MRFKLMLMIVLSTLLACHPGVHPQTSGDAPDARALQLQISELRGEILGLRQLIEDSRAFGTTNRLVSMPATAVTDGNIPVYNSSTGVWDNTAQTVFPTQDFAETVLSKGTGHGYLRQVSTANNTTTDCVTGTLASNTVTEIDALIVAVKSAHTGGMMFKMRATWLNNSGTVTQLGTTVKYDSENAPAVPDPTLDNSTTTWRVRVTGDNTNTYEWFCWVQKAEVIP